MRVQWSRWWWRVGRGKRGDEGQGAARVLGMGVCKARSLPASCLMQPAAGRTLRRSVVRTAPHALSALGVW